MIGIRLQVSVHELLALGLYAASFGLDGDEDRIDLCQNGRVVVLEHPTILSPVVCKENAETLNRAGFRLPLPPGLERKFFQGLLLFEVIGIKNKRLTFGVKDTAER